MKRNIVLCLCVVLLSCLTMPAQADVIVGSSPQSDEIKVGQEVTIDDLCSFAIKSIKEYDQFMNVSSGDSKQFLVISFSIINWRTESLYLKTQMKAILVYDEDFEFESNYLWANPEGSYYSKSSDKYLYVFKADENGGITSNGDDIGGGFENMSVKFHGGYVRDYDPINISFYYAKDGNESSYAFHSVDKSKTVFDPLVRRTMHYVFSVPNIVAKDEGLRVLTLTIEGHEYQITF